jgi:hypothetical protein
MKELIRHAVTILGFAAVLIAAAPGREARAEGEDPAILRADRQFIQAAAKGDTAALGALLDGEFTWTDANGKTESRAVVMKSVPKPALGDEAEAAIKQLTYGEVGAVMASREKLQVLRIWVRRHAGWRLLVYHEVRLSEQPPSTHGTGVADCENPCKEVPYKPKNEAEQGIIASWQALETGVTHHDAEAWAPHIADEFVMVSSNNDRPLAKADRIATLNKQKETGVASAPSPLVSAQMFDFGDAVVMTCLHQPHAGKPVHVSRVLIKRDGKWVMAISYQTTIQAGEPKMQ